MPPRIESGDESIDENVTRGNLPILELSCKYNSWNRLDSVSSREVVVQISACCPSLEIRPPSCFHIKYLQMQRFILFDYQIVKFISIHCTVTMVIDALQNSKIVKTISFWGSTPQVLELYIASSPKPASRNYRLIVRRYNLLRCLGCPKLFIRICQFILPKLKC